MAATHDTTTQTWEYCEETGWTAPIEAVDADDAIRQAKDLLRGGDWGELESTCWPRASVTLYDDDGDEVESHRVKVAIDPEEPVCDGGEHGGEHEWRSPIEIVGGIAENPGVWGHGGGVIVHEVCRRCGWKRISDSWAQDPDTGEQGLNSVRYEEPDDDTLAYVEWVNTSGGEDLSLSEYLRARDADDGDA